jgi:endogenous inhibitor of DNA gyrase (YacG/DUF329 family)
MTVISDRELLSVWDAAQDAHPAARPLFLLRAMGGPDAPEQLPILTRDRLLLALRERWFGTSYESMVACPACGTAIELTFDTAEWQFTEAPNDFGYRLPNTTDLLAISACSTEAEARRRLVERCIVGENIDERLPAVTAALDAVDDLRIAVACPDCGEEWEVAFDPGAYLWHEVDAAAVRVLREIDALASSYGWTEETILALSPRRRAFYLRMVTR